MAELTERDIMRLRYNVKDVLYTFEVFENLYKILQEEPKELQNLYKFQMEKLSPELVSTMNRGVRIDVEQKEKLYEFFSDFMEKIRLKINDLIGMEFNMNSTPQKKKLFKDFFGIELKMKKRKGAKSTETADAAAMKEYAEEYPMLRPFLTLMLEYNAIKVFTRTFLAIKLDDDNRARTQYKIAGTGTGRLASTKNVWGKGGNLQNLPPAGKLPLQYALDVLNLEEEKEAMELWEEFIGNVIEQEQESEVENV